MNRSTVTDAILTTSAKTAGYVGLWVSGIPGARRWDRSLMPSLALDDRETVLAEGSGHELRQFHWFQWGKGMVRIPTTVRIAGFQTALAVSALLLGLRLFLPDPYESAMRHRAQLCEAVAANGVVLVTQNDLARWKRVMSLVLDRDDALLSAGVRRADGSLLVELGQHDANWPKDIGDHSTDTFVHVPINDHSGPWGRLELRYRPIFRGSFLQATLFHPWMKLVGFFAVVGYGLFHWQVHHSSKQLDSSRASPKRFRSAYDFLAGGLVALDTQQEIVLCNQAFQEIVGLDRDRLLGALSTVFRGNTGKTGRAGKRFPGIRSWSGRNRRSARR